MVNKIHRGETGYFQNKSCISFPEIDLVLANSADPDEMPPYAAFHLGLHCLHSTRLEVSRPQRFKMNTAFELQMPIEPAASHILIIDTRIRIGPNVRFSGRDGFVFNEFRIGIPQTPIRCSHLE